MIAFIAAYQIISAVAFTAMLVATPDITLSHIRPTLGRWIVVTILLPAVFTVGMLELLMGLLHRRIDKDDAIAELIAFWEDTKTAYRGEGDE